MYNRKFISCHKYIAMSDDKMTQNQMQEFLESGGGGTAEDTGLKKIDDDGEICCPPEAQDLDSKKIKYCNLDVMTNMNKKGIADVLNVSPTTLSNWDKETKVSRFKDNLKKQYSSNQLELLQQQNAYIRQQAFIEMMDRLRAPDPENDLDPDATVEERQMYMERFIENMPAKDFVKMWKMIAKQVRLDEPEGVTEKHSSGVDPDKVREKRSKIEKVRKEYRSKSKKVSEENSDNQESDDVVDVEVEDENGGEVEAELVDKKDEGEVVEEEEEITVEKFKIR